MEFKAVGELTFLQLSVYEIVTFMERQPDHPVHHADIVLRQFLELLLQTVRLRVHSKNSAGDGDGIYSGVVSGMCHFAQTSPFTRESSFFTLQFLDYRFELKSTWPKNPAVAASISPCAVAAD